MSDSCLINLNTVCLICLQNESDHYQSVFEFDDQSQMLIAEKISRCTEFNLLPEDNDTPDKICNYCLEDLAAVWRFRKNCEAAKVVFESIRRHEEEASLQASIELEQQKIKLPSGLKIKRVKKQPYVVSIKPEKDAEKAVYEIEMSTEMFADSQDDEHYEVSEYYDEETLEEEDGGASDEETKEKGNDTFERMETDNMEQRSKRTSNAAIARKKPKDIKTEYEVQSQLKATPKKRGRGRPKRQPSDDEWKDEHSDSKENEKFMSKTKQKSDQSKSSTTRKRKLYATSAKPAKICEICGNCYRYQHALNAHMRRHTNDKPFGCEFCDKAFVSGVELRRHMRVHTGHKPYPCQYCDRRFSDFGSRIKHERTHTGERPYCCSTCGKSFAYAHVLSVHLRTHTGEKKFQCEICGKGLTKKTYLEAHMQNHVLSTTMKNHKTEYNIDGVTFPDRSTKRTVNIKSISDEELFAADYIVEEDDEDVDEKPNIVIEEPDIEEGTSTIAIDDENLEDSNDIEYILDDR